MMVCLFECTVKNLRNQNKCVALRLDELIPTQAPTFQTGRHLSCVAEELRIGDRVRQIHTEEEGTITSEELGSK